MDIGKDPLVGDWIDVSRPLTPQTPVWSGDRALEVQQEKTANFVLSSFETTCHVGTHVDAPFHLDATACPVDKIPLQRFLGRAEIVRMASSTRLIGRDDLTPGWRPNATRLLFRSDSFSLDREIGPGFSALAPEFVRWLGAQGVHLVGIDTPSVDPFDSTDLAAHHALMACGVTWIEGLWLDGLEAGIYDMVALPMALVEVEGAPIRVVLRPA